MFLEIKNIALIAFCALFLTSATHGFSSIYSGSVNFGSGNNASLTYDVSSETLFAPAGIFYVYTYTLTSPAGGASPMGFLTDFAIQAFTGLNANDFIVQNYTNPLNQTPSSVDFGNNLFLLNGPQMFITMPGTNGANNFPITIDLVTSFYPTLGQIALAGVFNGQTIDTILGNVPVFSSSTQPPVTTTPEPSTWIIMGSLLALTGLVKGLVKIKSLEIV